MAARIFSALSAVANIFDSFITAVSPGGAVEANVTGGVSLAAGLGFEVSVLAAQGNYEAIGVGAYLGVVLAIVFLSPELKRLRSTMKCAATSLLLVYHIYSATKNTNNKSLLADRIIACVQDAAALGMRTAKGNWKDQSKELNAAVAALYSTFQGGTSAARAAIYNLS